MQKKARDNDLDTLCSQWSNDEHTLELSLTQVFETGGMIYS